MKAIPHSGNVLSFRDPAGSVVLSQDSVIRTVRRPYDEDILRFVSSPLAAAMAASSRLVSSEVLERNQAPDEPALLLGHPRVPFISYPWEWPPVLWRSAGLLTLDLCSELIAQGWILKDATPLNVLFNGVDPVFVDVASVARLQPTVPLWFAYSQFVRTFILPLLAFSRLGWPLSGALQRRDGYEPEDLYRPLGLSGRMTQPARSLVTTPVLLQRRFKAAAMAVVSRRFEQPADVAAAILQRSLRTLRRHLENAAPTVAKSEWSAYATTSVHYGAQDAASKLSFVSESLQRTAPKAVLDVGCNTGTFSALAAEAGARVIAIDNDLASLDRVALAARQRNLNIQPLAVDLSRPTPAAGWAYGESVSFLDRARGGFDLVLMLAVIHHLLLQAQVPLEPIADLAHQLTRKHLLVEWVPQNDPKFQELLRGRGDIYGHLTEKAFRAAFSRCFTWVEERRLDNGRSLHLMERK